MKRINTFLLSVFTFLSMGTISGYAQSEASVPSATSAEVQDINWASYSKTIDDLVASKTKFYIYDINNKKFVTTGGQYGVQPIAAESGMAFTLTQVDGSDTYYIHSNVKNDETGLEDCVGVKLAFDDNDLVGENKDKVLIYIDRGRSDRVEWNYKKVDGVDGNAYVFYSSWDNAPHYIAYYNHQFFVEDKEESNAGKCYLISEDDYTQVILSNSYSYINISNMVMDGRFERMNKDASAWKFKNDNLWTKIGKDETTGDPKYVKLHGYLTNHAWYIKDDNLAFGAAWIGQEYDAEKNEGQELYQEITGLPAGYYRVDCQGFYKGEGLGEAYLFANDRTVRMQKLTDDDAVTLKKTTISVSDNDKERDLDLEALLKAGKFLADGNPYQDGNKYTNSVYVKVEQGQTLRLGMKKTSRMGDVFADNFQLYYAGNREWYLSAANASMADWQPATPEVGINKEEFAYPVRYNLRRKFDVKKWNTFIVPFDIKGDQVKTAFSGDTEDTQVKVSKFKEVTYNNESTQIIFEKVNLDQEGIKAHTPYIIWVGKDADVADKTKDYTFEYTANTNVTVHGPLYHIDGITPMAFTDCAPVTTEGNVAFHGFYYRDANGAPVGSYILSNGTMYHLDKTYTGTGIVGTCWYMQSTDTEAKPIIFSFEGSDGETTEIESVAVATRQATSANDAVYTIAGMRVGSKAIMSQLQPGIYIVNGKKVIK